MNKIEPVLNNWKYEYDVKQAEIYEKERQNKSVDLLDSIAQRVSINWDIYQLPHGRISHIDKKTIMEQFALSARDFRKVLEKVQSLRFQAGYAQKVSN